VTAQSPNPEKKVQIEVEQQVGSVTGGKIVGVEVHHAETVIITADQSAAQPEPGDPPYKGLDFYDVDDVALFFGREKLTAELVALVREHAFLAIVGASGSGKSSLARAGLVAALLGKANRPLEDGIQPPFGSRDWHYVAVTPTAQPLEALARALAGEGQEGKELLDALRSDPKVISERVTTMLGASGHLLLLVDQFEELFTLCKDEQERNAYVDALLSVCNAPNIKNEVAPCTVILTLRADFYPQCGRYPALRGALELHQKYIGSMNYSELQSAIELPTAADHWAFQQGLVELILEDVGDEPGNLPLLSYAMQETWKRRSGRVMTLAGYDAAGRVRDAINRTAERVYTDLDSQGLADVTRRIFLNLVDPGEEGRATRRREALHTLVTGDSQSAEYKTLLALSARDSRLLTVDGDVVQISHEALITAWPKLGDWLRIYRDDLQLLNSIREATVAWLQAPVNEKEDLLTHRGGRLDDAIKLRDGGEFKLAENEMAYLAECLAFRDRQLAGERKRQHDRFRLIAGAAVVALVLAVLAGIFGVQSQNNANIAATRAAEAQAAATKEAIAGDAALNAEQLAKRQAAIALSYLGVTRMDNQADLGFLLSSEAYLHEDLPQTHANLLASLLVNPRLKSILHGHNGSVLSVAFSPKGGMLASGENDGTIRLWDAASGQPFGEPLEGHTGRVNSVVFSPNGELLASGGEDDTIRLWNPTTGKPFGVLLEGHTGGVSSVAFSPTGKVLALGGYDGTIRLWDAASGQSLGTPLEGLQGTVFSVAFSPDGKLLASGMIDGTIRLWDAATGQPFGEPLEGHTGSVYSIAFSPVEELLASGGEDGNIRMWDVASGLPFGELLKGHTGSVNSVAFSPDGKLLVSGGMDGTIRLWGAASGQPFSEPLKGYTGGVFSVAFSPKGGMLASGGYDGTICLWDLTNGQPLGEPLKGQQGNVYSIAFSPDGKLLASSGSDGTIRRWDAATGQPFGEPLEGQQGYVFSVAFSSDGKMLASGGEDGIIRLWDAASGQPFGEPLEGQQGTVYSVAFSPDGKLLASGGEDGTIHLWDAASGQPFGEPLKGQQGYVSSVAFSPDGKLLASGGEDGTIRLWGAASGQPFGESLEGHKGGVWSVAFSPNGKLLASGGSDGTIRLWNSASGQPFGESLKGHKGSVRSVAFNSDNKVLASGGYDGTIRLWDSTSGQPLGAPLEGQQGYVFSVAFSPDGMHMASTQTDGYIWLWDFDPQHWLSRACQVAGRNFTQAEWQQYFPGEPYHKTCPQWPEGE
jgi:WD40 repeat protein